MYLGLEGKRYKWRHIKIEDNKAERRKNPALHSYNSSKSNTLHSKEYMRTMTFPLSFSFRDCSPAVIFSLTPYSSSLWRRRKNNASVSFIKGNRSLVNLKTFKTTQYNE